MDWIGTAGELSPPSSINTDMFRWTQASPIIRTSVHLMTVNSRSNRIGKIAAHRANPHLNWLHEWRLTVHQLICCLSQQLFVNFTWFAPPRCWLPPRTLLGAPYLLTSQSPHNSYPLKSLQYFRTRSFSGYPEVVSAQKLSWHCNILDFDTNLRRRHSCGESSHVHCLHRSRLTDGRMAVARWKRKLVS